MPRLESVLGWGWASSQALEAGAERGHLQAGSRHPCQAHPETPLLCRANLCLALALTPGSGHGLEAHASLSRPSSWAEVRADGGGGKEEGRAAWVRLPFPGPEGLVSPGQSSRCSL